MTDVWRVYAPDTTGLKIIALEDTETKTIVSTAIANPAIRVASHRAWAGARHSRSSQAPWEIMRDIKDADSHLATVFHAYGHASVGDMARLQIDFTGVPMHLALALFNLGSINSGQEKSTRYQKHFSSFPLHSIRQYLPSLPEHELNLLELSYQGLSSKLMHFIGKFEVVLEESFAAYYKIDRNDKEHSRILTSRVLDCTRSFHPFGRTTGFSFETSARDWSRIIGEMKASPIPYYTRVASQIEQLLAPDHEKEEELGFLAEAPSLIRHTAANTTTNDSLAALQAYLEQTNFLDRVPVEANRPSYHNQNVIFISGHHSAIERVIISYIKLIYPKAAYFLIREWLAQQDYEVKQHISRLLFHNYNHHHELPSFALTTHDTLIFRCSLGEVRDLNRHRGFGRFLPLPLVYGMPLRKETLYQILSSGYGLPAYFELEAFAKQRAMLLESFDLYYKSLLHFIESVAHEYKDTIDYSFILNLLPLAHQIDFWMHGNPKQLFYFSQLRSRPGGHINYRLLAHEASEQIAWRDPYFAVMEPINKPDPASRAEFLDRS